MDSLQSGLEYIEQNLKTIVTSEELAGMAGYSVWHYCRLFAQNMGMPVAGYIRKRRLDRALLEISQGRKAAQVVPEYGFDTYAGFYSQATLKESRIASSRERKRGRIFLSLALIQAQKFSIGFRSGEYGGKNSTWHLAFPAISHKTFF